MYVKFHISIGRLMVVQLTSYTLTYVYNIVLCVYEGRHFGDQSL